MLYESLISLTSFNVLNCFNSFLIAASEHGFALGFHRASPAATSAAPAMRSEPPSEYAVVLRSRFDHSDSDWSAYVYQASRARALA
jgi:hypothetical protein